MRVPYRIVPEISSELMENISKKMKEILQAWNERENKNQTSEDFMKNYKPEE